MKLIKCKIANIRALKDVQIDFSTDPNKPLTVIRAANAFGKTTLLNALRWGLFGDSGLEDPSYRFSPDDVKNGRNVGSVEIDFEVETGGRLKKYRVIRKKEERLNSTGEIQAKPSFVQLKALRDNGNQDIENADAHIAPFLPHDLKDVFFTDGDRALNFIEGGARAQRDNVEKAIRSLLDLNIIESSVKHISEVSRELNTKVKAIGGSSGGDLADIAEQIREYDEQIPELETQISELQDKLKRCNDAWTDADKKLQYALSQGNKDQLTRDLNAARKSKEIARLDFNKETKNQSELFRSPKLAVALLRDTLASANGLLNELHTQGKIPNQTIPVLIDRLNQADCICGESLQGGDEASSRRRKHIEELIDSSQKSDEIQKLVTDLYFSSKTIREPSFENSWAEDYSEVLTSKNSAYNREREAGEKEANIERQIEQLPDLDIAQLREKRATADQHRTTTNDALISFNAELDRVKGAKKESEAQRDKLLAENEKGLKFISQLEIANDLKSVLDGAFEQITSTELKKVSSEMNQLFTRMIGTSGSDTAVIKEAKITENFEIRVISQAGNTLNPSIDLNGASRRALTLSFILALTKISGKIAPNVVDTPLGMTSGYVKQSILSNICQESSQLVLMLTHSEIADCEELIDKFAGNVVTFTNTAFYPDIVKNPPPVDDNRVLTCACNHRNSCELCEIHELVV